MPKVLTFLKDLLGNLSKKPATIKYPFEPPSHLPEGFRGKISIDYNKCVGCGLCSRVCPAFAIEMIQVGFREVSGKKIPVKKPKVDVGKCLFCAQCAEVCPSKAITLTKKFELASERRENLIVQP